MARRAGNGTKDTRDWLARAQEQVALAEKMPAGAAREEAIKKAHELRSAGEMMRYLQASDLKAPH